MCVFEPFLFFFMYQVLLTYIIFWFLHPSFFFLFFTTLVFLVVVGAAVPYNIIPFFSVSTKGNSNKYSNFITLEQYRRLGIFR